MFDARATTYLVLGCRSAGKLTPRGLTTKEIAPPRHPQNFRTTTAIRVAGSVQEANFP